MTQIVVQIELIVFLLAIAFVLAWAIWYRFTRKLARKKYNPDNDKSRKGGEYNEKKLGTTKQRTDPELIHLVGHEQPKGGQLLPETVVSDVGTDSNIPRKNSSGIRKLLGRRKKWMNKQ